MRAPWVGSVSPIARRRARPLHGRAARRRLRYGCAEPAKTLRPDPHGTHHLRDRRRPRLPEQAAAPGQGVPGLCRPDAVVCLKGNHEHLAIMAHDSPRAMPAWLANSGATTQRSYWRTGGWIPEPHLSWLRALPLWHDDGLRFYVHAGIDLTVALNKQSADTMMWMREPFLTDSDRVECGRFVVHGHTPMRSGKPELRRHRVNLDTGAVIGGPLTAAAFDDTRAEPLGFVTDRDAGWRWWIRMVGR